jgi:oligopeptide transport system substrate-binding protein
MRTSFLIAIASVCIVAGCHSSSSSSPPPVTALATITSEVRIGSGPLESIDPSNSYAAPEWTVIDQMFLGLTRFDPQTGELTYDLATSATVSANGLVWTFTLRGDVVWSDGRPVTASDVEFGIKRALDPRVNESGSQFVLLPIEGAEEFAMQDPASVTQTADALVKVKALSPTSLEVRLRQPAAYLLGIMSTPMTRALPRHVIDANPDTWLEPGKIVVSGAYKLVTAFGTRFTLDRNPRYFRAGGVSIDRVIFDQIFLDPRDQNRARYLAGEFELVALSNVTTTVAAGLADPALAGDLFTSPNTGTFHVSFNTEFWATTRTAVRKALSQAIDRESIALAITGDPDLAARTFTPPTAFGAVPESAGIGLGYDPVGATQTAASDPDFPATITLTCFAFGPHPVVAGLIEADWERVLSPLEVELNPVTNFADWFGVTQPGTDPALQMPAMISGWVADYPDANNFLNDVFHGGSFNNSSRYASAAYDALVDAAAAETNPETRKSLYRDAEELLCETDAASAPLYNTAFPRLKKPHLNVVGDRVERWSYQAR